MTSLILTELHQTCSACPSQWEGTTDDGQRFYARYRWGKLTWGYGATADAAIDASIASQGMECGHDMDGQMSTHEMLDKLDLLAEPQRGRDVMSSNTGDHRRWTLEGPDREAYASTAPDVVEGPDLDPGERIEVGAIANPVISNCHRIDASTTISDDMTSGAVGASLAQFIGKTIDLVYEVPDSDRSEVLVRFTDGTSLEVSCDPGYDEDLVQRTPEAWETCIYDTTETPAGAAIRNLDPGHWL